MAWPPSVFKVHSLHIKMCDMHRFPDKGGLVTVGTSAAINAARRIFCVFIKKQVLFKGKIAIKQPGPI
jgi:hypothetical protein